MKKILGEEALGTELVNSYHHQAIKDIGDAFRPVAWSKDGLIEAIESIDRIKSDGCPVASGTFSETIPETMKVFKQFVDLINIK